MAGPGRGAQPPIEGTTGPAGIDPGLFRRVFGRFATGVTVITTRCEGHEHAMTANSVTSVSLEPLQILVCIHQDARFHDALLDSGAWGVSVLSERSRAVADWLATPGRPLTGQLDRVAHHPGEITGVPLLTQALARLECRTTAAHPAGDHTIVVGEVVGLSAPDDPDGPLVFYRGEYRSLG
ncbi:NADH-FMN oxidoreductase RutF, flavin reductase (DIM6/NTAB) family [Austwickia chelonae]|uniref:Putative oxidoreductase n=2 Tax=Austwickia TaxID=1184606 RepID=K6VSB3_9MICO|nr:putative oxidoreductase [Austwickia chelonae NBRC 105200]SEV99182.1 NADH-FMN oxidoreductase RutF, flavin reductase (DIM6/NTAB) family [Austwickia chelonae]